MTTYPSVYKARMVGTNGSAIQAFVPQVFGDTPITVKDFIGSQPTSPRPGWVVFQGGNPSHPVWLGLLVVETETEAVLPSDVEPTPEVWIGPGTPPPGTYTLWIDIDENNSLKALVNGAWATTSVTGGAAGGGTTFVYNQGVPSATWVITHNLGAYPNVTVEDSAGTTVEGEIVFNTANQLTLTFSAAFSGVAYLS